MTELEVLYKDLDRQEQRLYKQLQQIERLEQELADKDAQITKLTAQLRAVEDFSKVHQEQHAQSRENAKLLYTTLRRAAPDVLKGIEGALWQSTNEYDKLMSEGRRWQEKCQQSEHELAESREECRRLRNWIFDTLSALSSVQGSVEDNTFATLSMLCKSAAKILNSKVANLAQKVGDK